MPGGTRTPYPRLRRALLYPDELQAPELEWKGLSEHVHGWHIHATEPFANHREGLHRMCKFQAFIFEKLFHNAFRLHAFCCYVFIIYAASKLVKH